MPEGAPQLSVRAAPASLPAPMGHGGTNFVSVQPEAACLVCSGPGPAPWPVHQPPALHASGPHVGITGSVVWVAQSGLSPVGPPSPPFLSVRDDHGR
jgi:hypothetical protein